MNEGGRDLLDALNDVQRKAAAHIAGPMLVLAGAGSGKTRVLTYRVANLIRHGVYPGRILAVTFTNKAAGEMRERIEHLVGPPAKMLWMGTFHAISARMLRQDGGSIGVPRDFVVFDDSDQMTLMREVLTRLGVNSETYKPRQVLSALSRWKEELIDPEQATARAVTASDQTIARVYREYQRRLRENHALDFDDLIVSAVHLLEPGSELGDLYRRRFEHVLIDEYQDVNRSQYEFVTRLASGHRNLCVVGDDDQSVYGWRGADVGFILAFEEDYPDARILKLEQNYRSTQLILDAAHAIVSKNSGRRDKRLWTENPQGQPLVLLTAEDETDEARFIAQTVEGQVDGVTVRYRDFACLYRTNAQSRVLEDVFRRRRIPYRLIGSVRFYDRKEIKDILCYLRLIFNPADSLALKRVLNAPTRGVGEKSIERLEAFAAAERISLFEAMARAREVDGLIPKARSAVLDLVRVVGVVADYKEKLNVTALVQELLDRTGYRQALQEENTLESRDRVANVDEFINVTREFDDQVGEGLDRFIEQMALMSDVDTLKADADAAIMMTLHAAKGLEFPQVFLCGMEEDIFPHSRARDNPSEMEEERRLCYVGITRAQRQLYLLHARRRTVFGLQRWQMASRFLREIPEHCFDRPAPPPARGAAAAGTPPTAGSAGRSGAAASSAMRPAAAPVGRGGAPTAPRPIAPRIPEEGKGRFKAGDRVKHSRFGEGIVTRSVGSGDDEEVTVVFPAHGSKRLVLAYAPLQKLT